MYASEGVMMRATAIHWPTMTTRAEENPLAVESIGIQAAVSASPTSVMRRLPHRDVIGPYTIGRTIEAIDAAPNSSPTWSGDRARSLAKNSGSTGSNMASVAAATTTAAAHNATTGTRMTLQIGCAWPVVLPCSGLRNANPAAHASASTATNSNGSLTPPTTYNQPPIDGPTMTPKLVADITYPITRPRSSGP